MVEHFDMSNPKEGIGRVWRTASARIIEQADNVKLAARDGGEKLTAKTPDEYEEAIAEYNSTFTAMNDQGLALLRQRERSTDLIELVELLVNSLANTPKSFEAFFEEIEFHKAEFLDAEELAKQELEAARKSAASAGAGFAAGAAIASVAPTAAMWVATTFGTASTGTAISTLSGAVASKAALAWLGGGALAAGGGGTAAGGALLALAGPIGWTVAGASLLTSIALFAKKKFDYREARQAALTDVKHNTALVKADEARIEDLLRKTTTIREELLKGYGEALVCFGEDFLSLSVSQQKKLGVLVNITKSCAALLGKRIERGADDEVGIR